MSQSDMYPDKTLTNRNNHNNFFTLSSKGLSDKLGDAMVVESSGPVVGMMEEEEKEDESDENLEDMVSFLKF